MEWLLVPLAYLIGGVPFGLYLGRRCGVDVLTAGSGNIGATNVWRLCGPKVGVVALVLDIAKGLLPVLVARLVAPEAAPAHVLVAAGAVCGHTFSPYLGFRGGKAVGTSLGCCLALAPAAAAIGFGTFILVLALSRYVSLGSLLGSGAALVATWALHDPAPYSVIISGGVVLIWVRHKANVQRLLRGEESRFRFGGSRAPAEPPA